MSWFDLPKNVMFSVDFLPIIDFKKKTIYIPSLNYSFTYCCRLMELSANIKISSLSVDIFLRFILIKLFGSKTLLTVFRYWKVIDSFQWVHFISLQFRAELHLLHV